VIIHGIKLITTSGLYSSDARKECIVFLVRVIMNPDISNSERTLWVDVIKHCIHPKEFYDNVKARLIDHISLVMDGLLTEGKHALCALQATVRKHCTAMRATD
jgi:hypothetical protein